MVGATFANLLIAAGYWGVSHAAAQFFAAYGILPLPVWPAAAIALVAVLVGRYRWLPGIALGSFLANAVSLGAPPLMAAGISVMNTLGPLAGALLIHRYARSVSAFHRLRDVAAFFLFGVLLVPALTASGGIASLWAGGLVLPEAAVSRWLRWWVAHGSGTLLLAPMLLAWWLDRRPLAAAAWLEFVGVSALSVLAALLIFFGPQGGTSHLIGFHFLLIVPLAWLAVRAPPRETLTLFALLMLMALAATAMGFGPFVHDGNDYPLLTVGLMALAYGLMVLVLAALAEERRLLEAAQREALVRVRDSEARLAEAQEIAGVAHWEYDGQSDQFTFNDRFYALYHTTAARAGGYRLARQDYVTRYLHPADAEQVGRNIALAVEAADPGRLVEDEARVIGDDGVARWVMVRFHYLPATAEAGWKLVGTVIDIDERKRQQEYARSLLDILEAARDIIASADTEGRLTYLNAAGRQQLGVGADADVSATRIADYHSPETARRIVEDILPECIRHGYWEGETIFRRRDGSEFPASQVIVAHYRDDGSVSHLSTIARDISERRHAEAQLRLLANVFQHSGEAIVITDRDNNIVTVNPAFTRLTGYGMEEVVGRNPRILSSGRTSREEYAAMWQALMTEGFWQGEIWDRRRDGSLYPKWLTISTVRDSDGAISHYIAGFTDITQYKQAAEQIHHLAHHDALTDLPNRLTLRNRLEQALSAARRDQGQVAVMFIDLDRFKTINDTLGHQVGDQLLVAVAERLKENVRDSDVVARLGGDEFVVVLTGIGAAMAAAHVAGKLLKDLSRPYTVGGHVLHTTPSIGIGVFPGDGDSVDALMRNADTAMYHAKSLGRNNYQFFTAAMNRAATERLMLENSLRGALERGEFLLEYQPQVDVASGRVAGVEALVRWRHPEQGLVPPLKFIQLAEETGLIVPLGAWVLDEACRQAAAWRQAGVAGVTMAVNLSAHQLREKRLPEQLADILQRHGLAGADLELEITESVAMENPEATIGTLESLRAMGIRLAIDDFGTGYSSLSYLKLLPIHSLKLDRSFVKDIETDANDAAICSATIALGHNLGLILVAEGVENEAQLRYLARLGCDVVQGYWFSRPLGAEPALDFILARNSG